MEMKIDQMFRSHTTTERREQTNKESLTGSAVERQNDAHAAAGVRVTLTKSANSLTSLVKSANGLSEANMERIDRLRSTIHSGNYEIDSQKIARKLMEFEFGLK